MTQPTAVPAQLGHAVIKHHAPVSPQRDGAGDVTSPPPPPPHCRGIGLQLDQLFPGHSPDSVLIQDSLGFRFYFAVPAKPRTHIVVLHSLIVKLYSDNFAFRVGQGLDLEVTEWRPVLPLSIEVPEHLHF